MGTAYWLASAIADARSGRRCCWRSRLEDHKAPVHRGRFHIQTKSESSSSSSSSTAACLGWICEACRLQNLSPRGLITTTSCCGHPSGRNDPSRILLPFPSYFPFSLFLYVWPPPTTLVAPSTVWSEAEYYAFVPSHDAEAKIGPWPI